MRNAANEVLTARDIPISLTRLDNLPLTLEKTVPAANAQGREPHHPIQLYFNRPVALADLRVVVKHTVHGPSYSTDYIPGAMLQNKYQGEVVELHLDQAPVAGALSLVPGERIVEFYPATDLPYGSEVFVEVYERVTLGADRELVRFIYKVRANPTFINAGVTDQFGAPLRGIQVSLPQRGLTTHTDNFGGFSFGAGLTGADELTAGSYKIVVNQGGKNPAYGRSERLLSIESGKVNNIGMIAIPVLDTSIGPRQLQSGVADNTLANGDIVINTTQATLTFPNGGNQGSVQSQMVDTSSGLYRAEHIGLTPLWMFNQQPGPINVRGTLALQITLPSLDGSFSYLPADGSRVLLMGQSADTLNIVPIGVGVLQSRIVTSQGPVSAQRLDFIGVTLVAPNHQTLLQDFAEGRISLQQLTSRLAAE